MGKSDPNELKRLLARSKGHVHCMGAAGIGLAGLAYQLRCDGWTVSGCDLSAGGNRQVDWLMDHGVQVFKGHSPEHLQSGVDWIVHSTAVPPSHPELQAARAAGLPVYRRGAVLAAWLQRWTAAVVCGAHGKTTTTAMLTQILRQCGLPAAWCIGGDCPALDGVAGRDDGAQLCVVEADESDGTLAEYAPDVTVLTNVEFDHAEHYANLDELRACFATVLARTRRRVIYCADDPEAAALGAKIPGAIGYGFNVGAAVRGDAFHDDGLSVRMRVSTPDAPAVELILPTPGRHNALNALGAYAAALELGCAPEEIARALKGFVPVRRRFETIFTSPAIRVFSDYAHHPTEIAAAVSMLSRLPRPEGDTSSGVRRRLAVYQPHRYSRTRTLVGDFPQSFAGIDELLLAPVYAASEPEAAGGTIWDLYAAFRTAKTAPPRVITAGLEQIWEYLRRTLSEGDDLLVAGAGDVARLTDWAAAALTAKRKGVALNPIPAWRDDLRRLSWDAATQWRVWQPLSSCTTWRVGGPADVLFDVGSLRDAVTALRWAARRRVPVTCLGAGSNVLVSDLGVRGLVLRLSGLEFRQLRRLDGDRIEVGAGVRMSELTAWCAEQGLGGLEFLHGIPGTLGGALRMNAGAWGMSIGSHVLTVRCLDRDGVLEDLMSADLEFGYRACPGLANRVVVGAVLQTLPAASADIRSRLAEIAERRSKANWGASAGSVFRNPPGDYAGRLLEAAGCKGLTVGGARVADKHANVITAGAGTTASDILTLIEMMKKRVSVGFNVELVREIVYCE